MTTSILRPIRRDDLPHFLAWINDYEVIRTLSIIPPVAEGMELQFLERALNNDNSQDVFFAFDGPDGKYAGNVGLHGIDWISRKAEMGIVVGRKELWGKGIGSAAIKAILHHAFIILNLNRVFLRVFSHNPKAIKLYQTLGFIQEGQLRNDTWKDGSYRDTLLMGIMREEWEKLHNGS